MFKDIVKKISVRFVKSFPRNSFYKYIKVKVFWRNRYVLYSVGLVLFLNILIWFFWFNNIIYSGFATESYLNFVLNIPFVSRVFSLLFLNLFITLLNLFLAFLVYQKNKFSSFVLIFSTIFINFSILLVTLFYIFVFKL